METDPMLQALMRPRDFQRRNPDVFNTYSALRYHLDKRHHNGLVQSGAVVETALGLRINTERFPAWFMGKGPHQNQDVAA
jgi:hypothetical protein